MRLRKALCAVIAVAMAAMLVPSIAIASAELWEFSPNGQHPLALLASTSAPADGSEDAGGTPPEAAGAGDSSGSTDSSKIPGAGTGDGVSDGDGTVGSGSGVEGAGTTSGTEGSDAGSKDPDASDELGATGSPEPSDEASADEEADDALDEAEDADLTLQSYGGSGTQADPYRLSTAEDFKQLAAEVDLGNRHTGEYFVITNDITSGWEGFSGVGSVVDVAHSFAGNLDGGNHLLSGLNLTQGLFAQLYGPAGGQTIENLRIDATLKAAGRCAGIIAGSTTMDQISTIRNCTVSGCVDGNGFIRIGGVVGYLSRNSSVSYCTVSVTMTGTAEGGIAGWLHSGYIGHCFVTGSISSGDTSLVGGIAGMMLGGSTSTGGLSALNVITGCYVNMDISAGEQVGGIAGDAHWGHITACRFNGTVRGRSWVGGIVGMDGRAGTGSIAYNIAQGTVSAEGSYAGGIIGCVGNTTGGISSNLSIVRSITGSQYVGRVCGAPHTYDYTTDNNYAWSDTLVNGSPLHSTDANSDDGADVGSLALLSTASVAPPMNVWGSPWTVRAGHAPQIGSIPAQPDWPSYLSLHIEGGSLENRVYTGEPQDLSTVRVYTGNTELTLGTDYTISLANAAGQPVESAIDAGAYTLTVTTLASGSAGGVLTESFPLTIVPASLEGARVSGTFQKPFTGEPQAADLQVAVGGRTLVPDVDYVIAYEGDHAQPGRYPITITGIGNYTGVITGYALTVGSANAGGEGERGALTRTGDDAMTSAMTLMALAATGLVAVLATRRPAFAKRGKHAR